MDELSRLRAENQMLRTLLAQNNIAIPTAVAPAAPAAPAAAPVAAPAPAAPVSMLTPPPQQPSAFSQGAALFGQGLQTFGPLAAQAALAAAAAQKGQRGGAALQGAFGALAPQQQQMMPMQYGQRMQ